MTTALLLDLIPSWLVLGGALEGGRWLTNRAGRSHSRQPDDSLVRFFCWIALILAVAAATVHARKFLSARDTLRERLLSIDQLSLSLVATLTLCWTVVVWVSGNRSSRERPTATGLAIPLGLAGAVWSVTSDHLLIILGGLSLTGWCGILLLVTDDSAWFRRASPGKVILFQLLGDLLFLAGLQSMFPHGANGWLSQFSMSGWFSLWNQTEQTYWVWGVYLLICALWMRSTQFPWTFWTEAYSASSQAPIWLAGVQLPSTGWVIIRTAPLWSVGTELRSMVISLGVLSLIIVALSSLTRIDRRLRLFDLCTAACGLVWIGTATGDLFPGPIVGLLIASSVLYPILMNSPQRLGGNRSWFVWGLAILWGSGVLGQDAMLLSLSRSLSSNEAGPLSLPPLVPWLLPIAQGLLTISLLCAVGNTSTDEAGTGLSQNGQRLLLLTTFLGIAGSLAAIEGLTPGGLRQAIAPGGIFLSLLIAAVVTRWWERLSTERQGAILNSVGIVRRLGTTGFYVEPILWVLVVLPCQTVLHLSRFVQWFLVEGFTTGLTVRLSQNVIDWSKDYEEFWRSGWPTTLSFLAVTLIMVLLAIQ